MIAYECIFRRLLNEQNFYAPMSLIVREQFCLFAETVGTGSSCVEDSTPKAEPPIW